jgi:apolipoprotein N-acyltransferase
LREEWERGEKKVMRYFLKPPHFTCLIAGMLLPLAFAPFGYAWMAILSPALLLGFWLNTSASEAFRRGWWYGLGFFGVGASWIYVSIHQYGNTNVWVAILLTFIFVAFLGLFPAVQGYLLQTIAPNRKTHSYFSPLVFKAILYFPVSWVFAEWVRSWILTGFPWLLLGHSQVDSYLGGFAPLIGVFGVTSLVVLLSGLVCLVGWGVWGYLKYPHPRPLSHEWERGDKEGMNPYPRPNGRFLFVLLFIIALIFLLGFFLKPIEWTIKQSKPIRVALVQGNVPQALKWSQSQMETILRLYPTLSRGLWQKNDLVVWPEGAITLPLPWAAGYLNSLLKVMRPYPVSLIMGIPAKSIGFQYYNAMILIGKTGIDIYYKRYLVPFGEYLPLKNYLKGLIGFFDLPMSDFIAGSQRGDITLQNKKNTIVAPFVCYEIAYPEAILNTVPHANLMVVLSNDTWFGRSFAPEQHLQIARFAALASGRYMLVSTNDGISAIIDAKGKVVARAPRFQAAVLQGHVFLMQGNTPWVVWTHKYILFLLGFLMIAVRIIKKS